MQTGERLKDLIILSRQIAHHYQLEDYTDEALKPVLKALEVGRKELIEQIGWRDFRLPAGHEDELLESLSDMTFGIQNKLTGDIVESASVAGQASYKEYGDILSFKGKLTDTVGFNFVSVAPAQLKAMVLETPMGGRLLTDWVGRTFEGAIAAEMDTSILTGYLKGEGIEKIVNRLTGAFDIIKRDAESLTRTYIADANNSAAKSVYDANSDIVDAEEWCATLEFNSVPGRGTCMSCGLLDGRVFKLDEPHVRPPKHPNCRCFMLCKTKSYRDLGLNIDELKDAARPYTTRDGKKILKAGQFDGNFEDFFNSKGVTFQKGLVGPNRLRLMKEGKVEFSDLVDDAGDIRLLRKGKDGGYVGIEGIGLTSKETAGFVPAKTIQEAEQWASNNGVKLEYDGDLSTSQKLTAINNYGEALSVYKNRLGINIGDKMTSRITGKEISFGGKFSISGDTSELLARQAQGEVTIFPNLADDVKESVAEIMKTTSKEILKGEIPCFTMENNVDILTHELGHTLENALPMKFSDRWEKYYAERGWKEQASFYGQENSWELFAESVNAGVKGNIVKSGSSTEVFKIIKEVFGADLS